MNRYKTDIRKALMEYEGEFATIDKLREWVSSRVDLASMREEMDLYLNSVIRQQVKSIKGDDGESRFESILETDSEGKDVRVYKQVSLFHVDDFRQTVTYFSDRTRSHAKKANYYARKCHEQTGVQLPLPFPSFEVIPA